MTPQEYLEQAYRLDQKLNSSIEEDNDLRGIIAGISSPLLGDRVQTSQSEAALFEKNIEKLMELEKEINREIGLYADLKKQVREVISAVADTDERMVLIYRYVHNYSWTRIGETLHVDPHTALRWHRKALSHVVMPEDPIRI